MGDNVKGSSDTREVWNKHENGKIRNMKNHYLKSKQFIILKNNSIDCKNWT